VTLTFDLLTSNWGHESPVSWASLLPTFSFPCHTVLELESDTGQTDRRTERQRSSLHNAYSLWGGDITNFTVTYAMHSDAR